MRKWNYSMIRNGAVIGAAGILLGSGVYKLANRAGKEENRSGQTLEDVIKEGPFTLRRMTHTPNSRESFAFSFGNEAVYGVGRDKNVYMTGKIEPVYTSGEHSYIVAGAGVNGGMMLIDNNSAGFYVDAKTGESRQIINGSGNYLFPIGAINNGMDAVLTDGGGNYYEIPVNVKKPVSFEDLKKRSLPENVYTIANLPERIKKEWENLSNGGKYKFVRESYPDSAIFVQHNDGIYSWTIGLDGDFYRVECKGDGNEGKGK